MATQQEKLQQLIQEFDNKRKDIERTVYYDDFVNAFKALMGYVEKAKQSLVDKAEEQGEKLDGKLGESVATIDKLTKEMADKHDSLMADLRSDQRTFQRMVSEKLTEMNDSIPEDYDDGELRQLVQKVADSIPEMPEAFDPTDIMGDLEKLEKDVEELKNRPVGKGGGVTNMRIAQAFKTIFITEAPTGDIDGLNTVYTTSQPIFAVISITLNGETIAELPNYTVAGRTITFTAALPSAYSGKDFEIKYIAA